MKKILVSVAAFVSAMVLMCSCEKEKTEPQNNQENQVENRWDNEKWTTNVLLAKNGEDSVRQVKEYGADGKILSYKQYDASGELSSETTYSYKDLVVTATTQFLGTYKSTTTAETTYKDASLLYPLTVITKINGVDWLVVRSEYDGNQLLGAKFYEDNTLVAEEKNFQYSKNECTFLYQDYAEESDSYISKTVYADEKQTVVLEETKFATDGTTELEKTKYEYDEQGRMTSFQYYVDGKLSLEYTDFQYDGKTCQYKENKYYNGVCFSNSYRKTFL